jgi:hypothetical protein
MFSFIQVFTKFFYSEVFQVNLKFKFRFSQKKLEFVFFVERISKKLILFILFELDFSPIDLIKNLPFVLFEKRLNEWDENSFKDMLILLKGSEEFSIIKFQFEPVIWFVHDHLAFLGNVSEERFHFTVELLAQANSLFIADSLIIVNIVLEIICFFISSIHNFHGSLYFIRIDSA